MAYTTTTRLGLKKAVPGSNQPFETAVFNENYDKIDAEAVAADTRLDLIEAKNGDQDSRLTVLEADMVTLENVDIAIDARLDALEVDTLDARLDVLEGQNLNTRLTAAEGVNTTQNGRLDAIETLNGTQNSRITATEDKNSTQDQRLTVLEIAAGYPPVEFSVDGGTP